MWTRIEVSAAIVGEGRHHEKVVGEGKHHEQVVQSRVEINEACLIYCEL